MHWALFGCAVVQPREGLSVGLDGFRVSDSSVKVDWVPAISCTTSKSSSGLVGCTVCARGG